MSRRPFCFLGGAVLVLVLTAGRAGASCPGACDPTDPLTGPCCNADCTFVATFDPNASDNTGAECIAPANECKVRYCDANHQCTIAPNPDQNRADGEGCSPAFNKCVIGSCSSGTCVNANVPRCSVATCDPESCTQTSTPYGYNFNPICTDVALSNPPPTCNQVISGTCYPGICNATTRQCDPNGTPKTCDNTGVTTGICSVGSCVFDSSGNPVCSSTTAPAGTTCADAQPWDCNFHKCDGSGTGTSHCSVRVKKPSNSVCDATPNDNNHCTLSICTQTARCRTGSQYQSNLAYNTTGLTLAIDTDGNTEFEKTCPTTTAAVCQHAACGGNSTTNVGDGTCASTPDTSQNGNNCSTDTCTTMTCSGGTCGFVSCKDTSTACSACSVSGHCNGAAAQPCSCVQ